MDESREIATQKVLGAGALLSLALLAGRLAGLIRETILAARFGASIDADVAVLLLTLPDLLVSVILSGGLSAALVPRLKSLGTVEAAAQFRQASILVGLVFGVAASAFAALPLGALRLLAPGLVLPGGMITATSLLAVSLAIPATALAGVSSAYLNAENRFFVSGCGTLIFNSCVIVGLLMGGASGHALPNLCVGIFFGAVFRWGVQLIFIPRDAWQIRRMNWHLESSFLRKFAAAAFASSLMMLVPLFVRAAASVVGPGSVAIFNYATKLVELPVGILITSVSVVALSRLGGLYATGDPTGARRAAKLEVQRAVLLAIAVLVPALWFSDSVVTTLFGRGQMDATSLARITSLTRIALLGMPCVALSSMAATHLYAQGRVSAVLNTTLVCVCLLPVFCSLGLVLSSANWLMAGVVAFQVVLAVSLARRDRLSLFGCEGWLDSKLARLLVQSILPSVLIIVLSWGFGVTDRRLQIVLAGIGFALGAGYTLRHLESTQRFSRSNE